MALALCPRAATGSAEEADEDVRQTSAIRIAAAVTFICRSSTNGVRRNPFDQAASSIGDQTDRRIVRYVPNS